MTQRLDSELILRRWFEDGPSTMPDRVVDTVAERIGRVPQRRGWRRAWANPTMRRTLRWAALAAATIALILASIWLIGQTRRDVVVPSLPPPTLSNSTAPSLPTVSIYDSDRDQFKVPFSVELVDGFVPPPDYSKSVEAQGDAQHAFENWPDAVMFSRGSAGVDIMSLENVRILHQTAETPYRSLRSSWDPYPTDLAAWLRKQPNLAVDGPRITTIGGRAALAVDTACAKIPYDACFLGIETASGKGADLNGAARMRVIEVRMPGGTGIVIAMVTPKADFDAAAEHLDHLLATLTFH